MFKGKYNEHRIQAGFWRLTMERLASCAILLDAKIKKATPAAHESTSHLPVACHKDIAAAVPPRDPIDGLQHLTF
jgi:hypothetical protein